LAIHGFAAGELVVCRYRMPSVLQPWIHSIYVGTVEEPGDDPALWNGSNSERHYCELTGTVPIRYEGGWRQLDFADRLVRITPEEAALSHQDRVRRFLGEEAYENLIRASLPRVPGAPVDPEHYMQFELGARVRRADGAKGVIARHPDHDFWRQDASSRDPLVSVDWGHVIQFVPMRELVVIAAPDPGGKLPAEG
jgi:hypothetical protein